MQEQLTSKGVLHWDFGPEINTETLSALIAQVSGLHPIVAEILCKRNCENLEGVKRFLTPGLDNLEGIPEMKDLQKAAERVLKARDNSEKILVYGDYDVDGSCATAMMYTFLRELGADVSYYNPDRYAEGYGISEAGIRHAREQGYGLIIALDCGIAAIDRITEAAEAGIDVIVCDHHQPGDQLPAAHAILNPKQPDCGLYGEELCGCGVGFMLIMHMCHLLEKEPEVWKRFLPLVAIATCCDIVDLTGLNRSLVKAGLDMINENPPAAVAAMLQTAAYQGHIDVSDVVFKLGPRINAAGRLAHARDAVELLIQNDLPSAMPYAHKLESLNLERRALDKEITAEAVEAMMAADPELKRKTTVVKSDAWHKGVIGIVASRLTEVCYRPTVVCTEVDGMLTCSARSVVDFDLYSALKACAHLLTAFGGHHSAAGLSLTPANFPAFCEAFEASVSESIGMNDGLQKLHIDKVTDFAEWHDGRFHSFFNQLCRLKPFGPKNREPIFATYGCQASNLRVVGKDHLKFQVSQKNKDSGYYDVIAFGFGHLYPYLSQGGIFDMAYAMGSNTWNGKSSFQLEAKDIRTV